ncbi:YopX family protein [Campylobacter sp.]|uniref:YopX family protein n=1 Tax=Campylobacter sp. TaxID=205 RepID=UPI0025BFA99D|nr:YopX family protein [Campylobacter sp.]
MKLKDFDFRIWNNTDKEYIKDIVLLSNLMCDLIHGATDIIQDCEIELFTGLYDKNGKKIYENDILKFRFNGTQEIIAYANAITYNGLFFTSKDNGLFPRIDDYSYRYLESEFNFSIEIIGNIHKNPELLKC